MLQPDGAVGEAIYFAAIETIMTEESRYERTTLRSGLFDKTAFRYGNPFVVFLPVAVTFLREPAIMLLLDFAVAGPVISAAASSQLPAAVRPP